MKDEGKLRKFVRPALVVILLTAVASGYHRYKYPYGSSHRCSKILSDSLMSHAREHQGEFPKAGREGGLGLATIVADSPDSEFVFELVVGKAGDLKKARRFWEQHGFLNPEHSSWHYVEGLSEDDEGLALAWDKIPLSHNGARMSYNPREVIMVGGMVRQVNEAEWPQFLEQQQSLRRGR